MTCLLQDPLDLAQFQQDGNQGYGLTSQSSQEYSPKHGYHGYPGDNYHHQQPPPARNGDVGSYHGHQSLGGAPPPAPSLPPGGGLPPPLPPGRKNHDSTGSMPGYPAPHFPPHQDSSNGLGSVSPPPPPPGFDMGATITTSTSHPEELYEKRLPTRMDEIPASMLHGGSGRGSIGGGSSVGGEFENFYGSQLPPPGGLDNGYPSPHELYETTLPRPSPLQQPPPQPPSVLRRSSSSSSGSHKNSSSSYAGSRETIMPPESYGAPPPPHMASPDADFPPPPPPQFFQTMPSVPSAPSSMPGSPQRPPPPTLPKPRPGKPSQANGGPPPPPPPPLSTMPRANNHHQQYNAPPPPPPLSTMPSHPPSDVGGLASQLQGFNLRSSPPEGKIL